MLKQFRHILSYFVKFRDIELKKKTQSLPVLKKLTFPKLEISFIQKVKSDH